MNTIEKDLILKGLYRDREELAAKLNDVDKLIRKIKTNNFALNSPENLDAQIVEANNTAELTNTFPYKSNIRVQVLYLFDLIGVACRLNEVQDKYKEITGTHQNLRETLRTLNKHDLLKLLRPNNLERGLYWVKTTWLENNGTTLKDEHKFQGFELLYAADRIEFV